MRTERGRVSADGSCDEAVSRDGADARPGGPRSRRDRPPRGTGRHDRRARSHARPLLCLALAAWPAQPTPSPDAAAAGVATPGAGSGAVEVPLRVHDGRLWVPVRAADGTDLAFLLSTGSAVTVLSETGARRLGDAPVATLAGEPIPMEGRQTFDDARLEIGGRTFDGILGSNTLNPYDLLIDGPGERLVLRPASGRDAPWPGVELSEPVRLRVYHGVVIGLDVELGGRRYPAMLELGAPGILVNERVLAELGLADGGRADLRVGTATFAGLAVRESDHPAIGRFSPDGDGFVLVGSALPLACPVALSWVRQELRTCIR